MTLSGSKPELRADASEDKRGLRLDYFAVHLKQRIDEKVYWAARRLGVHNQVAAFRQFKTIGRIMPEIVIRQLWIFPCFADINGNPPTICQEFGPTMIAIDRAFVFFSRNGCTDRKAGRDADAARQCNKIGMKIRAVTRLRVTCVHSVTATPAGT